MQMIQPIDMITDYEWRLMDRYRTQYGPNEEQELKEDNKAPIKDVLHIWSDAKNEILFKWLGNQLIYSEKVRFVKSSDQMYEDFDNELFGYGTDSNKFTGAFYALFRNFSSPTTGNMFDGYLHNPEYYNARDLLQYEYLATNIYNGESFKIPTPDGKVIAAYPGSKVSKVLKKFAEAFDLPCYEEFRITHSQILNNKELTGELTLSIHPMDYMTMSDNNCGWDSCMKWTNYGEYRQGTIEMMNSKSVIVAYLNADSTFYPFWNDGEFTWSNKKWRQLFICDKNFITGVKGYPYYNADLTNKVLDILKRLAAENLGWNHYTDKAVEYDDCADIKCEELTNKSKGTYLSFDTCHMYNDFCKGHFAYLNKDIPDRVDFTFSGESMCIWCGETGYGSVYDNAVICEDCGDAGYYCAECGEFIGRYSDDVNYIGDDCYCNSCYHEYYNDKCDYCYESLERRDPENHSHETYRVHYFYKDHEISYYNSKRRRICADCWATEPLASKAYYPEKYYNDLTNREIFINIDDLTEEGKLSFGKALNLGLNPVEYFKKNIDDFSYRLWDLNLENLKPFDFSKNI